MTGVEVVVGAEVVTGVEVVVGAEVVTGVEVVVGAEVEPAVVGAGIVLVDAEVTTGARVSEQAPRTREVNNAPQTTNRRIRDREGSVRWFLKVLSWLP